jgi:hypothetical protein
MLGCARPGADRTAALSRFGGDVLRPRAALPRVCWCREPVDLRKGMRALALLVEQTLGLAPFGETLAAFSNRRRPHQALRYQTVL